MLIFFVSFGVSAQQKHITLRASVDTAYFLTQEHFYNSIDSLVATFGPGGITQLTGDVTAGPGTGSQVATIGNNKVVNAMIRQSAGLSVIGRSTNSTGNVADITAGTDGHILRRNGTSIDFGSINLASSNAVGSSVLPAANGGTGLSSFSTGDILYYNSGWQKLAIGTSAQSLRVSAGLPIWRDTVASVSIDSIYLRFNSTASSVYSRNGGTGGSTANARNVGVGPSTLTNLSTGTRNMAVGYSALNAGNGSDNVAVGSTTLVVYLGNRNTAVGSAALAADVGTGNSYNTAAGYAGLTANTSGVNNTGLGALSLTVNQTGSRNTATGTNSLALQVSANDNTASGYNANANAIPGSANTEMGASAFYNNTGIGNTGMGFQVGLNKTSGNYNLLFGYQADPPSLTGSGQIVLTPGNGNVPWFVKFTGNNGLINAAGTSVSSLSVNTSAAFEINGTAGGLLLPRLTKTQRDAIASPAAGLAIYQTDNTPGLRVYNGTNWMRFTETAD